MLLRILNNDIQNDACYREKSDRTDLPFSYTTFFFTKRIDTFQTLNVARTTLTLLDKRKISKPSFQKVFPFFAQLFIQHSNDLKKEDQRRHNGSSRTASGEESQPSCEFSRSARPEWRINQETTGCQFISPTRLFRISLLRLPHATTTTTTTCTRYAGQLANSVEGKGEKVAERAGSFRPTAGKLYEVLSAASSFHFTGRRLFLASRIRFNAKQPIRRLAIEPHAIFPRPFWLLLYLPRLFAAGSRLIVTNARDDREIIVWL